MGKQSQIIIFRVDNIDRRISGAG